MPLTTHLFIIFRHNFLNIIFFFLSSTFKTLMLDHLMAFLRSKTLFISLSMISYNFLSIFKFTDLFYSACSNLLLSPSREFFISVILLFSSRISILFLNKVYLFTNAFYLMSHYCYASFTSLNIVSFF